MEEKEVGRSGMGKTQLKEKAIRGVQERKAVRKPSRRDPDREGVGLRESDRLSRRLVFVSGIDQAIVAAISPLPSAVGMVPVGVAVFPGRSVPMAVMAGPFCDGSGGEETGSSVFGQKAGKD